MFFSKEYRPLTPRQHIYEVAKSSRAYFSMKTTQYKETASIIRYTVQTSGSNSNWVEDTKVEVEGLQNLAVLVNDRKLVIDRAKFNTDYSSENTFTFMDIEVYSDDIILYQDSKYEVMGISENLQAKIYTIAARIIENV